MYFGPMRWLGRNGFISPSVDVRGRHLGSVDRLTEEGFQVLAPIAIGLINSQIDGGPLGLPFDCHYL